MFQYLGGGSNPVFWVAALFLDGAPDIFILYFDQLFFSMLVVEVVSCEHYLLSCDLRNVYVRVSQLYVSSCIRRLV